MNIIYVMFEHKSQVSYIGFSTQNNEIKYIYMFILLGLFG